MKRRNFFKSLAALAVIPILPAPKEEFKYIEFESELSSAVKHYRVQGDGHHYYTGMWTPRGPISHSFYGDAINHPYALPRHGVNSFEYISRIK